MFIEAGKPEFNRRMFPSPLGEMGLSIRVMTRTPCITLWNLSFRPLSGIGGINLS